MTRISVLLGLVGALTMACGDSGAGTGSAGSTDGGGSSGGDSSGDTPTGSGSTAGSTSGGSDSATGGGDPFAGDSVCSRDEFWTKGNLVSPLMHPGMACLTCHKSIEPDVVDEFPIAGTVYPTGHEPDDCFGLNGSSEPTFVEITMADARVVKLPVNSSGNFIYDVNEGGAVMFPITARVVQGDQERKMFSPQTSGDCNSCHTEAGTNGAPGRIVTP